jgi:hypothetical protein
MPIVGFTKQGTANLKTPYGPKLVGIINIRTSEREAAPQDNLFWYDLSHEHLLLKSLKRLHPVKLEQPAPKEEMVKLERKPQNNVIPAPDGIQEENKRACRICGCTDDDCSQCIEKTGQPCSWIEDDLCTACASAQD